MSDPGAEADSSAPRPVRAIPRIGRVGRVMLGIAVVILAVLVAVWIVRKPIAGRVIDRELARKGVVARYRVGDLGFGSQRLTDVVIGDPRSPDLVADWLETRIGYGLAGPRLVGVRAGHVRLRGRIVGGRLTLGELDKLMGPPSGKPFALPALRARIADARMRLETPFGVVGLKLSGDGRLDDGFVGTIAATAPRIAVAGCTADGLAAVVGVEVARGAPHLTGPLRADRLACPTGSISHAALGLDATLGAALDRWRGRIRLVGGPAMVSQVKAARLTGTVDFAGTAAATTGSVDVNATGVARGVDTVRRMAIVGRYAIGSEARFDGDLAIEGARSGALAQFDPRSLGAGTPLAPLVLRAGTALGAAARNFDARARLHLDADRATVSMLNLAAASGARLGATGQGVAYRLSDGTVTADARLALSGGGLPTVSADIARGPGGRMRGRAAVSPYAAGDARLALAPVSFVVMPGGAAHVVTLARLSGPIGAAGRVDGVTMPLDLRFDRQGGIALNPGCTPLAIGRLAVSGLVLDPFRTRLCAPGAALVQVRGGRIDGGARLAATHLTGRLGATPLDLSASGADLRLAERGFTVTGLAARLGQPDRVTRLDVATLTGRIADGGIAGRFSGGGGQIGAVPLLLGDAAGDWTFRAGALALSGGLTVRDTAEAPRFNTMAGRDVTLRLAGNVIRATGVLAEPTTGTKVADVTIVHDLAKGAGDADLAVPGITFTKTFQPDLLTRLTYGVVAEVAGTVTGQGHIGWSPAGVTSTGRFGTKDMNLAAAFGPVTGLSTTIAFTDLLNLESAPGQVATIKSVNPGVAANDGTIRYQTLPGNRVRIEGGEWPFAGGALTLLPTLLDFSTDQVRRMTFRIRGAAADQFLQQFDFQNIDATGVFDGELPIVFDASGGRIENGFLKVREGGGGIAYVGTLTQKDLGFWGNLAFQALKSLRYRSLTITMNGPLAGEMVTEVRFAGVSQGKGAKSNFLIRRLARLPFVFNIRIKAPFRGLLDSAQSFYDPSRLVRRNLSQLIDQQDKQTQQGGIQPPASETVP